MQLGIAGNGIHPITGETLAFQWADRFWDVPRNGPGYLLGDMATGSEVIVRPWRAFRGLQRPGKEQAFAYIARPALRFINESETRPAPPGWFFAVYFDEALTIYLPTWIDPLRRYPGRTADQATEAWLKANFAEEIRVPGLHQKP